MAYDMQKHMDEFILCALDRVCASPMKRAADTARILFPGTDLSLIEDLAEMDFGIFEGKDHQQLCQDERYKRWIDSGGKYKIPEGEGLEDFRIRSVNGFSEALGNKDMAENIAIVCHGGTIMAVMSAMTGNDYYEFLTENLGGYLIDLEMDDEGIHDFTYHRFYSGDHT